MTVYNGEKFLRAAIDSVLAQTFQDWELIIVDDASTDATPEILSQYHDARIQVLRNDTNRKQAYSSNRAIAVASGRYIARLDADDIALPHRLATEVAYLDAHPDVIMVASAAHLIDEAGQRTGLRPGGRAGCTLNFLFIRYCALTHSTILFRAEAARPPNAGYNEAAIYQIGTEDYEFMSRVAFLGTAHMLEESLIEYRVHPASATAINARKHLDVNDVIARANIKRAVGFDIDSAYWESWRKFVRTPAGSQVQFDSGELERLILLVPSIIRGFRHDPADPCQLPWDWARHAVALAIRPRSRLGFRVRLQFLWLAANIGVAKLHSH